MHSFMQVLGSAWFAAITTRTEALDLHGSVRDLFASCVAPNRAAGRCAYECISCKAFFFCFLFVGYLSVLIASLHCCASRLSIDDSTTWPAIYGRPS